NITMNNSKITILKRGNIYFFYRPKLKGAERVQRFFMVLSSQPNIYNLLVVGKKHLPIETKDRYLVFVEAVKKSKTELLESLTKEKHRTGKGETTGPTAHCLAEGKFIIAKHENHTHFIYQITKPSQLKEIQQEFNLQKEDDYLINVKNPQTETPLGVGLSEKQKANYPANLQEQ